MNVYALFEERTNDVFRQTMSGKPSPIKAKRLGKNLVRAMRKGIFKIRDAETAPALYTVLVSPKDEEAMRRALPRLADESAMLVASQAEEHGYGFVGEPLVRFVADPGMKKGKSAVVADNVDAPTLEKLRSDEDARRPGGAGRHPGTPAAGSGQQQARRPRTEPSGAARNDVPRREARQPRPEHRGTPSPQATRGRQRGQQRGATRPMPLR